ncbi:MAG: magnesium-protoporphyrin IX monomethyl ester oxidative cyclase, partial [Eubacteriales bacterium]
PKNMTTEEISRAVIDCYRRYYMDKIKEYDTIRDEFKRDYLLRSMKVMMENSFLVRHLTGMGDIPDEVRKYLEQN